MRVSALRKFHPRVCLSPGHRSAGGGLLFVANFLPRLFNLFPLCLRVLTVLGCAIYALDDDGESVSRANVTWLVMAATERRRLSAAHLLTETHIQVMLRLITCACPARPTIGVASIKCLDELQADYENADGESHR